MLSQLSDYLEWKAKRDRARFLFKKLGLAAAFIAAFWVAWNYLPQSIDLSFVAKQWALERQTQKPLVYYRNCDAARAAGVAPIRNGLPENEWFCLLGIQTLGSIELKSLAWPSKTK